jgi:hypothetical protein
MFSRPMLFLGVLIAAVAVPYVLLDKNLAASARGQWDRLLGRAEDEGDDFLHSVSAQGAPAPYFSASPAASTPTTIEQVFRFDVTPRWVLARWPRASTVAGEPEQLGMRMAIVTGTNPDDIAGSLTYYFDPHHRVQRVTFTGTTRDPRRLLASVITPYALKSQPTTEAAHYVAGDPREPTSEVIVSHPALLDPASTAPLTEVSVDLSRGDILTSRDRRRSDPDVKLLPSTYRRW